MGIGLRTAAALLAFLIARIVPHGRRGWLLETVFTVLSAVVLEVTATALDFGGSNEPDWRAALFVFFGCGATIAIVRLLRTP